MAHSASVQLQCARKAAVRRPGHPSLSEDNESTTAMAKDDGTRREGDVAMSMQAPRGRGHRLRPGHVRRSQPIHTHRLTPPRTPAQGDSSNARTASVMCSRAMLHGGVSPTARRGGPSCPRGPCASWPRRAAARGTPHRVGELRVAVRVVGGEHEVVVAEPVDVVARRELVGLDAEEAVRAEVLGRRAVELGCVRRPPTPSARRGGGASTAPIRSCLRAARRAGPGSAAAPRRR